MTIATDMLAAAEQVAARIPVPAVRALYVPKPRPDAGIEGEFALVVLEDGSAGLFFALLGDTPRRLHEAVRGADPAGRSPLALVAGIESDDEVERAVALGALSALTQHLFRRADYLPPQATSSMGGAVRGRDDGGAAFTPADRVGMVGLFPSLARRLRADGIPLTVLELRPDKVVREEGFEVTLDPTRLARCNRILCTASTLINGTLDAVLGHVAHAQHIALIGPSASCFPDPLFARRVHAVGGVSVLDAQLLAARMRDGEPWADAVRRYVIDAQGYPGLGALLARSATDG